MQGSHNVALYFGGWLAVLTS